MLIGGTLMTIGLAAAAFLPSLNMVIVSYGVIAGQCWSGLMMPIKISKYRACRGRIFLLRHGTKKYFQNTFVAKKKL